MFQAHGAKSSRRRVSGESEGAAWEPERGEQGERNLPQKTEPLCNLLQGALSEPTFRKMFQVCPAYLVTGSSCLTLVWDPSGQGSPMPLSIQTPLDVGGTARIAPMCDPGEHGLLFPLRGECGAAAGSGCPCAHLTRRAGRTSHAAAPGLCTGSPTRPSGSYPGQRRLRGATWLPPPPYGRGPGNRLPGR